MIRNRKSNIANVISWNETLSFYLFLFSVFKKKSLVLFLLLIAVHILKFIFSHTYSLQWCFVFCVVSFFQTISYETTLNYFHYLFSFVLPFSGRKCKQLLNFTSATKERFIRFSLLILLFLSFSPFLLLFAYGKRNTNEFHKSYKRYTIRFYYILFCKMQFCAIQLNIVHCWMVKKRNRFD